MVGYKTIVKTQYYLEVLNFSHRILCARLPSNFRIAINYLHDFFTTSDVSLTLANDSEIKFSVKLSTDNCIPSKIPVHLLFLGHLSYNNGKKYNFDVFCTTCQKRLTGNMKLSCFFVKIKFS